MKVDNLLELIQSNPESEELKGEFSLLNNSIVWSFKLDETNNGDHNMFDEDDEYGYFDAPTIEEQLQESYLHDYDKINLILDKIDESYNWGFTEPDVLDNTISFEIYSN